MIRALSLTIYHAENSTKLHYEPLRKQFFNEQIMQKWKVLEEERWEKIVGHPVKAYIVRRTKPAINIKMYPVLEATAKVMGVAIGDVLAQSRRRIYVDVRKVACMILIDADYSPAEIEKQLPFKNRIIYNYREKMEDRLTLEPGFSEKYEEIKRKVMDLTLNKNPVLEKKYNNEQVK